MLRFSYTGGHTVVLSGRHQKRAANHTTLTDGRQGGIVRGLEEVRQCTQAPAGTDTDTDTDLDADTDKTQKQTHTCRRVS
jgi:hypothetical protein